MANVKISNLPVETTLANMTGIAGYNAAGTAQISGANIISSIPLSNLQQVVDIDNVVDSNAGTGSIIFKNSGSNTNTTMSVNSISSDTSFSIVGTTLNTNLTLTSGGELRITPNASLGTPAIGDVLAAKNTLGDVEWVSAGGSTPDIQTVVNAGANSVINDQGGNRSFIDFREGNTTSQFTVGKDPGGNFGIKVGQGNFSLQGAVFQSIFLQPGNSAQKRFSLSDSTSGNATAELTSAMDLRLSSTSAFKCGGLASPGTSGQVLTSTGTSVEWTTPSTPNLDISNIDANTIKADLTQSSQPQYGQAIVMKANGAISNGEPVIWDYTSGVVTARTPTSNFTQQDAIGIALENIANGASGKILISGFATVKWDGVVSPPVGTEVVLNNSTNGTSIPLSTSIIPFRSVSGGTGSYPSSAGPWTIKFDAGVGNTVKFEIVDFEFEHGTGGSPMYDRGGWVVSPDNNTYSNAQLTPGQNTSGENGWLTSATSTVGTNVWSSSLGSSSSTSGYIFPENPTVGNVNIGDIIDLGERFAEYHFKSDGSSNFLGWDLKMYSSGLNPAALTVGQTMQADINSGTFNRLTGYQPGAPIYGYFIGGSTANNAVVCRIAPPRPVS